MQWDSIEHIWFVLYHSQRKESFSKINDTQFVNHPYVGFQIYTKQTENGNVTYEETRGGRTPHGAPSRVSTRMADAAEDKRRAAQQSD